MSIMHAKDAHKLPPVTRGFEHINRYWDRRMGLAAAKIMPGQLYVSQHGEMISTVLGSCISACIRDNVIGVGGMNHFMLPVQKDESRNWGQCEISSATRYGNWAMEYLINEIYKMGGSKQNLEVKLFGGGKVLKGLNMADVGRMNADFAYHYLAEEGLEIVAQDLGDSFPRKVLYFPDTGAVKVRKLKTVRNDTVAQRERAYIESINEKPADGSVELF